MSGGPSILLTNAGGGISDADVQAILAALQVQATRDFCPLYNLLPPTLRFGPASSLGPAEWHFVFARTSDEARFLGYHELAENGQPIAYVFTETTRRAGGTVSVTASHELLEMLKDPNLDQTVPGRKGLQHVEWIVEVCDPCEADRYGYRVSGVLMSDFTLPAYWHGTRSGPYSYRRALRKALPSLLPGGYLSYAVNGQWKEITARRHQGHRGSRGARRRLPRRTWRRSEPMVADRLHPAGEG